MRTIPYVFQDIMDSVSKHVLDLPYTYFQDTPSSIIANKMRGIGDYYYAIHSLLEYKLTRPLLLALFGSITLFFINTKIFLFSMVWLVIAIVFVVVFMPALKAMERDKQDSWHELFGRVSDCVAGITNVLTFGARSREIDRISKYYDEIQNPLAFKYYKYNIVFSFFASLIHTLSCISTFIFAIYFRKLNAITVGDIALIISSSMFIYDGVWEAAYEIKKLIEYNAALESSFTIMQVPVCNIDKPDAIALKATHGEIIWKDVEFKYNNDCKGIMTNFNLHIKPGQKIGIVGTSGAGKSTLISLLLKNFQITSGDIMIDNQSIYACTKDSVRSSISLIPQDIVLFHRSIRDNIGYAMDNPSQDDIELATKSVKLHDFIMSLPNGYDTMLGERGTKLSGGQRQRIAIARAILRKTKILILDEATSSLDSVTEQEIQTSVNEMLENNKSTVIAIAHRLSTIKHMDRIIVLDKGQIVEDGNFDELIAANGHFRNLWDNQTINEYHQ
jgi:ATP-binding cassette subfamily B protein